MKNRLITNLRFSLESVLTGTGDASVTFKKRVRNANVRKKEEDEEEEDDTGLVSAALKKAKTKKPDPNAFTVRFPVHHPSPSPSWGSGLCLC